MAQELQFVNAELIKPINMKTYTSIFLILLPLVLESCGQRRPGMSREEAVAELEKPVSAKETCPRPVSSVLDTFATDYCPPAGIRHQPKIIRNGIRTFSVANALRHIRELKPNEIGVPTVYPTGIKDFQTHVPLVKVENYWLLQGAIGLYLLNKDFRMERQLFRNDMEIHQEGATVVGHARRIMGPVGYDASLRMLRAPYREYTKSRSGVYVVNLPWDSLLQSSETWTTDDLVGFLPAKGQSFNAPCVLEKGHFRLEPFSSRLYTLGMKGDTLCRFIVNGAEDYPPTATYRTAEKSQIYLYRNKPRFRMAYDNTIYEIENDSTLKAIWKLDFGSLKRPSGKYVVENMSNSLDGYWSVQAVLETDRYLMLRLAEGYDCPAARQNNQVRLYTVIQDKQTGESFSLPSAQDQEGHPVFPNLPFEHKGHHFSGFPYGQTDGQPYLIYNGKQLKAEVPDLPEIADDELVLLRIN